MESVITIKKEKQASAIRLVQALQEDKKRIKEHLAAGGKLSDLPKFVRSIK